MRVLPKRLNEDYHKAKCDPEGEVEYLLIPLSNVAATCAAGRNVTLAPVISDVTGEPEKDEKGDVIFKNRYDDVGTGIDVLRLSLKGLRGLKEANSDEDFELVFVDMYLGGTPHDAVSLECLNVLPRELFYELIKAARKAIEGFVDKEEENANFTSD